VAADEEHKATIRLIGGAGLSAAPGFFQIQGKEGSHFAAVEAAAWENTGAGSCPQSFHCASGADLCCESHRFRPMTGSVGYERGVAVSKAWDEATTHAAIEVANHVLKNLDRFVAEQASDTNRAAKVEAFCKQFVEAAFRRPLTDEQKRLLHHRAVQRGEEDRRCGQTGGDVGAKFRRGFFISACMEHSRMITKLHRGFRSSCGIRFPTKLYYRSSLAKGALHTREQVREQARRMLADPLAHAKMAGVSAPLAAGESRGGSVEGRESLSRLYPPRSFRICAPSLNLFLKTWFGTGRPTIATCYWPITCM